ncbi:hypothetical protein [Pseudomonas sp. SLFW]|uniref:hypothetical protein n=1 Tax=Pseudomonas sp. SLFW TaxID=2683259 RepID=UPI0035326D6D
MEQASPTSTISVLIGVMSEECARPVAAPLNALTDELVSRFGNAVSAVLLYGSCLRSSNFSDGLVDLYVLVDSYANVRTSKIKELVDAWLPPTVFSINVLAPDGSLLRAKCALITLADFEKGTASWFHGYLWGRFSQPSRLVFSRDQAVSTRVHTALANAVKRMTSEALPDKPQVLDSATLWEHALTLTYRTELRPERASRPAEIVGHDVGYYRRITLAAVQSVPRLSLLPGQDDRYSVSPADAGAVPHAVRWQRRRGAGRLLNVLRLIKSFYTFENGLDYVIWKLERHLGEPVPISPRLRRYPLIFCWPLLWRLLRNRQLR